jgi:hypothetical protein
MRRVLPPLLALVLVFYFYFTPFFSLLSGEKDRSEPLSA